MLIEACALADCDADMLLTSLGQYVSWQALSVDVTEAPKRDRSREALAISWKALATSGNWLGSFRPSALLNFRPALKVAHRDQGKPTHDITH